MLDLEDRYKEGVCVGGGEIRLQGECKVDHGSLLNISGGRLCLFLSDKGSGFYAEDLGFFMVLRSKERTCAFPRLLKQSLGSGGERGLKREKGGEEMGEKGYCTSVRWEPLSS